ncbi:two-component sensor histidine kinase [Sporosarcina sp. NCCP-2222]|uniref:sensor histidine kinase n=1 Tax=Sporosarcina sp. NCCP-2222 TaxID=2935073 RepID=UPI0020896A4D|nr:HAMP domain-containing sensor histidine kinase [Sporosarcina sp. NCCP-2222]GKV55254.1 two-component sensor histidine kinase [Sporosarcina sp. NCCP-2222]
MKLSNKMTFRFILYFLAFYGILFIGTAIMFGVFIFQMMKGFYYHDIRVLEQSEMEWAVIHDDKGISPSDALLDIAERSGGIVQILDQDGTVLASSKDGILPTSYGMNELKTLVDQQGIRTWTLEDGHILLFEEYTETDSLLAELEKNPQFPVLTETDLQMLGRKGAIFELFSETGELLNSTSTSGSKPLKATDLLKSNSSVNERKELLSSTSVQGGNIAVIRMDNPYYQALDSLDKKLFISFSKGFVLYHLLLLFVTLGFSLWIGRRFGKPVFYFLRWMERLSKKDYTRLEDRKIRRQKDDRLKRKYRIYEDVDMSLTRLAANLQENERTINRTEKLREDWITGLSHDLKTPLSSIYGYAVMLESNHQWSSEEVRGFAKTMMEKAGYMDALINDLTYTYQLKNDGVQLEMKNMELHEYISQYVERRDWQNPIVIEGEKKGHVLIDPSRFERVLDNLIGNASKHNPPETAIHLHLTSQEEWMELVIQDEGAGIPPEVIDHLFNRYYRGTNTTTDESGTGLGLTIAKQLIEAHGGEVQVFSSSEGTEIVIRLPRQNS